MIEVKLWVVIGALIAVSGILGFIFRLLLKLLITKLDEISNKIQTIANNLIRIVTEHDELKDRVVKLEKKVEDLEKVQNRCRSCNPD